MANRRGKGRSSDRFPLLGLQNHCRQWLQPWNQKSIASWQESDDKPRQCVEKQRHYPVDKGPYSQGYGHPRGHAQLWELTCKEGRTSKNQCLRTVVLEKTPESPLDSKAIKPVNLKGDQPWIFTGRTDTEAEAPEVGHLMGTDDSLKKSLMLGKIEGRMRRGHQRIRWLDSITDAMNRWWRIGRPGVLQSMGSQSQTWLGDWTTTTMWSIQENIPCTLKKNICSVAFRWSALCIQFKTFWSFKANVSLLGFPCGSAGKESACNSEDLASISGLGRSHREGKVYPLQYSGLENSMDSIAHGVTKSQIRLSDFHFHY